MTMHDARHTSDAPRLARALIAALASTDARDAIVGDFEEGYRRRAGARGRASATRWYWIEGVRSAPSLAAERLATLARRSLAMNERSFLSGRAPVVLGLLGMIPTAFLFSAVFVQFALGNEPMAAKLTRVAHPLPLLAGLSAAILLNAAALVRVRHVVAEGAVVATVQLRGRELHLLVCAAACIALVVILGYLVTENFTMVPRHGPSLPR